MKAFLSAIIGLIIGFSAVYGNDMSIFTKIFFVYLSGVTTPFIYLAYQFLTVDEVRYVNYVN
jgi:hypothetical protein